MEKIYSSVINFFDENNQIDYQKIKLVVEKNLEHGQNKFYIRDNNFDSFHLSFRDKDKYYKNIFKLMPEAAEFLVELNFSFLNNRKEIIEKLNTYQNYFELVVKSPAVTENNMDSYSEDYLSCLNFLNNNSNNEFYLSFNTRLLNLINKQKLIEKSIEVKGLKGFVINPTYFYDLDFKEFTILKEKYSDWFKFLAVADDFYLLNLSSGVKTISKYFNLFPDLFKKINLEFKNDNLEKAKEYQLLLNDFITKVKDCEEETAFKYLLAKSCAFEFKQKKTLSKAKKSMLDSEFEKINGYFVDKV
ncbi:MAG: hypothetical protein ACQERL_11430 [Bacillota bacterium]